MELRELITIVRNELDDATQPYLWSDQELIEYFADGENEAARRARLLIDSSTAAICTITVIAGTAEYPLDSRVLFIRRALLDGDKIHRASYRDLDANISKWQTQQGVISHFVTDLNTNKLRVYPIPLVAGTLNMTVVRLPLADMNAPDDEPELKLHYQRSLRFWAMYRAYMKQDTETFNKGRAEDALALFEQEFGKKSSAQDEEWIEREQAQDAYSGAY